MKKNHSHNDGNLPADFDPHIYLELHADVKRAGVDPAQHYLEHGRSEGRPYRPGKNSEEWDQIIGIPSSLDARLHQNPQTKRSVIAKHTNIWHWIGSIANKKGFRVLELGSRSVVSDALWKNVIPNCEYTGFDVLDGKNVDIVGDAHRLSDYFEPNSFDLVISFAVFEHLAMPWVVSEEISKILNVGGYVCHETHFSFSEHELPWHFFQFNNRALEILFCPELGFEIIDSGLDNPIVGRYSQYAAEYLKGKPIPDLYCHSSVIAQKVHAQSNESGSGIDWRSVAERISKQTMYPEDSGMK